MKKTFWKLFVFALTLSLFAPMVAMGGDIDVGISETFGNISGKYVVNFSKGEKPTIYQIKDDGKGTLSIIGLSGLSGISGEEKGEKGEQGEQIEWGFMKFNRITGEVTKNETFDEIFGAKMTETMTVNLYIALVSSDGKITGSGTMQVDQGDKKGEVAQLSVEKISDGQEPQPQGDPFPATRDYSHIDYDWLKWQRLEPVEGVTLHVAVAHSRDKQLLLFWRAENTNNYEVDAITSNRTYQTSAGTLRGGESFGWRLKSGQSSFSSNFVPLNDSFNDHEAKIKVYSAQYDIDVQRIK